MANRRKEIPSFVSIEVGKVRGIAESMEDAAWARWSKKALDDLTMGCVRNDVDPIVKEVYDKSKNSMDREYQRKKKWYEANKKSPQDAPNGNAGVDVPDAGNGAASKSPTSCDQFTADGDTREDSQDRKSGTSANLYGDAATREGGAAAPTTVSRNMRRVPQNEAPAHGFSGGRTAQGTMSRSPEAAAQSGKAYDQESSISTDDPQPEGLTGPSHGGSVASLEARQVQARESRRAGGNSVRRVEKVSAPPVRSAGPMPADKQAVYDFAAAEGLDTADAYECWHVTVNERGGLTADGKPIKNWKAYVRKWCETRASRRNQ